MRHDSVVLELLEQWGDLPRQAITPESRLVADLKMDGDDLTFSFVPVLQKRLGFKAPREEWGQVVTVQDVFLLVERNLAPGKRQTDSV